MLTFRSRPKSAIIRCSPGPQTCVVHAAFRVKALRRRGVSSTVKLSVSKTELLGSNPSSPAKYPSSKL
jgi:hypothetical protein